MRSILYLLLLACVFASCKNTKSLEPDQSAGLNNIYAKWQLKSYSGGFVGYRNKPAEDGQFIEFKSDGTFNTYKNNALTGTTTFTIKK